MQRFHNELVRTVCSTAAEIHGISLLRLPSVVAALGSRKILTKMLNALGYECEEACNGLEAVKLVEKRGIHHFSCMFLDISMPVMVTFTVQCTCSAATAVDLQPSDSALLCACALVSLSLLQDGYECASKLRQMKATLPIIALTANAVNEEKRKALESGMGK